MTTTEKATQEYTITSKKRTVAMRVNLHAHPIIGFLAAVMKATYINDTE
jgi:hypothetical protein